MSNPDQKKLVSNVCKECGVKYGNPVDRPVGVWPSACDICGEEWVLCAAPRDYKYLKRLPKGFAV